MGGLYTRVGERDNIGGKWQRSLRDNDDDVSHDAADDDAWVDGQCTPGAV